MKQDNWFYLSVLVGLTSFSAGSVNAQLEEVIVVAQKREQDIQDVPITIEVLNADRLREAHIDGLQELSYQLVGVDFSQQTGSVVAISMRGQQGSTSIEPGGDTSTALFVDGVFMARPAMWNQKMFDLERIEVLKGPQGSLYGQNAMAGAINIYTRRPSDELYSKFELSAGEYNLVDAQGLVNFPVSDKVYGMFSFASETRDGFFNNPLGDDLGEVDTQSARLKFLFEPGESFDLLFSADFSDSDGTPYPRKPRAQFGHLLAPNLAGIFPTPPADFPTEDVYTQPADYAGVTMREASGFSLVGSWYQDQGTWTAILGHRDLETFDEFDGDGLSQPQIVVGRGEESQVDQVELRYASSRDGRFNFTGGLFYFNTTIDDAQIMNWILPGARPRPIFFMDVESEGVALFGEAYITLSDQTTLVLGGRESSDEKSGLFSAVGQPPGGNYENVTSATEWDNFSGKVGIQHVLSDTAMLFVTAAEGYKAGGLVGRGSNAIEAADIFEPETGINYEIGLKAEFGQGLRVNATYYNTEYENLQTIVRSLDPNSGQTLTRASNRNEGTAKGVEVQLDWSPTDRLAIGVGYGYLTGDINDPVAGEENTLPGPEHTLNLLARYSWRLAGGSTLSFRADGNFNRLRDSTSTDQRDLNGFDDLEFINLRLAYAAPDNRWELAVWGRNITDHVDWLNCFHLGPYTPNALSSCAPSEPSTYGVTWTSNFGNYQ